MKKILYILIIALFGLSMSSEVIILELDGNVDPPMAGYLSKGIKKANVQNAELILIIIDTPGGLLTATKDIVDDILRSNVPVVAYVYPTGARSASAGVFITMASHVAAMAPGTRIGAAAPVAMGTPGTDTSSTMMEKITNDAVAWIRSLAAHKNRNEEWAEDAVRKSVSITAEEAFELGVIEIIAKNIDELLKDLDSLEIEIGDTVKILDTKHLNKKRIIMSLQEKFLHNILNPNVAYLLLMAGLLGLYLELHNPGAVLPGVVGVISILGAAYAFQILPVNYVGVLLIIAGIIMFILEVKMPGFGLLFGGGLVSLVLGSFMLTSSNEPALRIDLWTILPTILIIALFFAFIVFKAIKTQKKRPITGLASSIGEIGEVEIEISPEQKGKVFVHGEIWNAKADSNIPKGTTVKVVDVKQMILKVEETKE